MPISTEDLALSTAWGAKTEIRELERRIGVLERTLVEALHRIKDLEQGRPPEAEGS